MRIRSIKPEFWDSQKLSRASRNARLLFIGLWCLSDDHGRFRAHPAKLTGALFAYDDEDGSAGGPTDVKAWLAELDRIGLIQLYEHEGQQFGFVVGFAEHQKIDQRWASKLPAPPEKPANPRRKSARLAKQTARLADGSGRPADDEGRPACEQQPLADSPPLEQGLEQGAGNGEEQGEEPMDGGMDGGSSYQEQNGGTVQSPVPSRRACSAPVAAGALANRVVARHANGNGPPLRDRRSTDPMEPGRAIVAAAGKRRDLA